MARFYTVDECNRKADQCWELAGCARVDGDRVDEVRRTEEARLWMRRAREGGWEYQPDAPTPPPPREILVKAYPGARTMWIETRGRWQVAVSYDIQARRRIVGHYPGRRVTKP